MLYYCPRCLENIEFGGVLYTADGERCVLCKEKLLLQGGSMTTLIWNESAEWSVPLPEWQIGQLTRQGVVSDRRFVPDETPVIPTSWRYRVAGHWYWPWELSANGTDDQHPATASISSEPINQSIS